MFKKFIMRLRRLAKSCRSDKDLQPLRLDGVQTVLTPEPDDAELAAAALLESLTRSEKRKGTTKAKPCPAEKRDAAYYRHLATRISKSRESEARLATRYVAYCEQWLANDGRKETHDTTQLAALERGLYQRLDTVEREGGELKRRWQKCLAEVTVRLMNSTPPEEKPHTDNTEKKNP